MANDIGGMSCSKVSWGLGIALGIFVALMLMVFGDWGFFGALLLGVIVAVALGFVLTQFMCEGSKASGSDNGSPTGSGSSGASAASAAEPEKAAAAPGAATTAATAGMGTAATPDAQAVAPEPIAEPEPEPEPSAPADTADEASDDQGEGTRPETLDAPRDGGADDLKKIKGVGPKMENMLNDMGFYHFDQIAAWSGDEVAWVDQNLQGFKGRVSRDNWVEQARLLASGGDTAFSRKVDKGDVY